ncbi:mediator of RNA polymerase II transcription subunit 10 [Marmota marmota marmota]|uniref:mediator of RNA polymerase II transcription subunit 10 n=1 Tax=Marmota marmota marmota TaxID=9994 RepID=UPI00209394DD|nr:mediator of RNA polymerase II transcription subunit 10 [Marmota marmota marmota]
MSVLTYKHILAGVVAEYANSSQQDKTDLLEVELGPHPRVLHQKVNFIVTGLQDIDKCRQQLHDITVPLEVFEYIDQGRNPQLYTKECLERALAKNEQVKGKIDTMKKFKSLLIQELSKVFPEDMAKYRSIRGEDHPPS